MLTRAFHNWERRLASAENNRVVRPFDWGLDWIDGFEAASGIDAASSLRSWAARAVESSDAFFALDPLPAGAFRLDGDRLTFPSAVATPHAPNNTVHARYFPDASER